MKEDLCEVLGKALPFWDKLTKAQKETLTYKARLLKVPEGTTIYDRREDCLGMLFVKKGRVCVYMLSDEGREFTLFRLDEGDICVLSAGCVINQIAFDVHVDTETDTEVVVLDADFVSRLMSENIYVENYVYKLMTEKFSDVMWFLQEVLFKRLDSRLAGFLYDEMIKTGSNEIVMTHEQIAKHLASAREVVSRMLKRFSNDKIVRLKRGLIVIEDKEKLKKLVI